MTPDTLIVVSNALGADGRRQVRHLVEQLTAQGRTAELLLVGGGQRSTWTDVGPTIDLDHLMRRRTANALRLVWPERRDSPVPTWRLRRYLRQRSQLPWILCHPGAMSLLDLAAVRPPKVVGYLADPGVATSWPTKVVAAEVIGALASTAAGLVLDAAGHEPAPVVISTSPHRWEAIDHMVEVVDRLHTRCPDLSLLVLTDAGDDEWLARHDLAHVGVDSSANLDIRQRDALSPLRPLLIVRTGYVASDPDLVLEAAAAGIPTLGFELGDLPELGAYEVAPFDVEELVDRVVALLDPAARSTLGATYIEAPGRLGDPSARLAPLLAMLGRTGRP